MIAHYLKVAVRNLLKYKVQSIISIVGLAIGLATFALSSIWLKYEMTYDTHCPDAERICQIGRWEENRMEKFVRYTSALAAPKFEEEFPEIEASCVFLPRIVNEKGIDINVLLVDSTYTRVFPITILQGNNQFLYDSKQAAITESAAMRLFGTTEVLGKTLSNQFASYQALNDTPTICALLKDAEGHSNYPYDVIIRYVNDRRNWHSFSTYTFVKLVPGVDIKTLDDKMKQFEIVETNEYFLPSSLTPMKSVTKREEAHSIVPLNVLHYTYPTSTDAIRLEHIRLFNVVSLVVVLCALINYLILYVIRLHIRRREMTLRRAHGASEGSLLRLTMTELLLLIVIATCLGMLVTELLYRPFKEIAGIDEGVGFLYRESAIYIGIVILLSLLLSGIMLMLQQRQSHRASLLPVTSSGSLFNFRRLAMGVQLFFSIFILFATATLQKQLRQLHQSDDMGVNMDVVVAEGWIMMGQADTEEIDKVMSEIPYINYYKTEEYPFEAKSIKKSGNSKLQYTDDSGELHEIPANKYPISYDAYRVYGLQTIAGDPPTESDNEGYIWVNESFVAELGLTPIEAIGKYIMTGYTLKSGRSVEQENKPIRGVFKNISISPIIPSLSSVYTISTSDVVPVVNYRYRFLTSDIKDINVLQDSISTRLKHHFPDETNNIWLVFYSVGDEIEKALQSERVLMKLLGIASGVCIFITLFGIFSMVNLTCERRRKEMAIRKVHGAKIRDIIGLFVKEYGILLLVSAAVAFSVGYAVMKQWLQTYVIQTTISWWIYVAILAAVTLMIVLCVGYRVWKAANENPADVVKSE